jgi:hypothetical protein
MLLVLGMFAGCAGNPSKPMADAPTAKADQATQASASKDDADKKDKKKDVYCRRVMPTGSHRLVTICMTAKEREQERKDAQRTVNDAFRHGGPAPPPGG